MADRNSKKKKVFPHTIFEVYTDQRKRRLYTKSLLSFAKPEFGERIVKQDGNLYREWDPKRSKLAAYIMNGCPNAGIRKDLVVLYLGASHGHTPSYVSDMVGPNGLVFAVDFAPRVVRDLVFISNNRKNLVPILADARIPSTFSDKICEVDFLFQDIAQREQADIFLRNVRAFLKDDGIALLAVKAKSIDMKKSSKQIFQEVREKIESEFMVTDLRDIAPFELDHCVIAIKKRPPVNNPTKANTTKNKINSRPKFNPRSNSKPNKNSRPARRRPIKRR